MKTRIRIGVEEERGGCRMEKTQQDDKKDGLQEEENEEETKAGSSDHQTK